jgi:phage-related holin
MLAYLKGLGLAALAFLAPIHLLLAAAVVLTLIDAVTGILAARKRREKIRSAGLRRTVSKLVVYQGAIVAGYMVEVMMGGSLPVSKLVAACIAVVEGKSVLENCDAISGSPVFGAVIDRLGSANQKRRRKRR